MKQKEHEAHCSQILGEPFPEVHKFLDQYHDTMGAGHRDMLHNPAGVVEVIKRWGMKAGAAACLHIWADEEGIVETEAGTFHPAHLVGGFSQALKKTGYIVGDESDQTG